VIVAAASAADSSIRSSATVTIQDYVTVTPAAAAVATGGTEQFTATVNGSNSSVAWSVNGVPGGDNSLGTISAKGLYTAPSVVSDSNVTITAVDPADTLASANAAVQLSGPLAPLKITSGGTYSGNWLSNDPNTPAVTIQTDEPVLIENSTVTGKGNLLVVKGSTSSAKLTSGANISIQNVTGVALDPGIAGKQRGSFVSASAVSRLSVTHCTMTGVSFGVAVAQSTLTELSISNNVANDMEDRASDGKGGFTDKRPNLGHFVILNGVHAAMGGDISWNQVIDTPGHASVEDIISIFGSSGQSASNSIRIHDNYLQGAFSPSAVKNNYTGSGIMTDGSSNSLATATGFVQIYGNQVVHTANAGIGIDAGHDISVTGNSVVSCGKDASGAWIATTYALATDMWNAYKTSVYFNNSISATAGGLVRPDAAGNPSVADIWAPGVSASLNNSVGKNSFTNPCMVGGDTTLDSETEEYDAWVAKLAFAAQTIGSQAPVP
jgi:hypothetical protein